MSEEGLKKIKEEIGEAKAMSELIYGSRKRPMESYSRMISIGLADKDSPQVFILDIPAHNLDFLDHVAKLRDDLHQALDKLLWRLTGKTFKRDGEET